MTKTMSLQVILLFAATAQYASTFSLASIPLTSRQHVVVLEMSTSPKRRTFFARFRPHFIKTDAVVNEFETLVQPNKVERQNVVPTPEKTPMSNWESFKAKFYLFLDILGTVLTKLAQRNDEVRLQFGYADNVESRVLRDDSSETPGQRLVREFQEQRPSSRTLPTSFQASTVFDSFKDALYAGLDEFREKTQDPETTPLTLTNREYATLEQPNVATSPVVKAALPELESKNPIKRWRANSAIKKWEEEQRKRQQEAEKVNVKETIYSVVDAVQGGVEAVASFPGAVLDVAVTTGEVAGRAVDAVSSAAETVASIPGQVVETVENVQKTVQGGIQTTKSIVEEAQALPAKVKRSVDSTKKTVDEAVSTVKVLAGLEERKPEPPKTPPPKSTLSPSIPLTATKFIVKNTAKAAWWVGKGALTVGVSGARAVGKSAVELGMNGAKTVLAKAKAAKEETMVAPPPKDMRVPKLDAKETESLDIDNLEEEVAQVIKMAEAALEVTDSRGEEKKSDLIDMAATATALANEAQTGVATVSKKADKAAIDASIAAVSATQDALEIEGAVNKKGRL